MDQDIVDLKETCTGCYRCVTINWTGGYVLATTSYDELNQCVLDCINCNMASNTLQYDEKTSYIDMAKHWWDKRNSEIIGTMAQDKLDALNQPVEYKRRSN